MEVQLYVYDLSKGLARQMSQQFLGIQIDAVYHTAIVFGGVEYLFGQGVQTCMPGSTHHGQPMEVISMGETSLPEDVIAEYLESLKQVYTAESYDLFMHNCNNFSNDFAMFLVGKGIPDHITSLPQTVLNTPFGQLLRPTLDQSMRSMTQAPLPPQSAPPSRQSKPASTHTNGTKEDKTFAYGKVHNVTRLAELESLLTAATSSCAVIFFTSSTCPPCKLVYPAYDELAADASAKATLIKVDIGEAYEIGSRYSVRATPTFITFLRGAKENQWVGANESQLRGNVRLLLQMAHPPHPHAALKLPTFLRSKQARVRFTKTPPMDKLLAKMGPNKTDPAVQDVKKFIDRHGGSIPQETPLPDLGAFAKLIDKSLLNDPIETLFPLIDLWRVTLVDPRAASVFARPPSSTTFTNLLATLGPETPYSLQLTALQALCNVSSAHFFFSLNPDLISPIVKLIATALLDVDHTPVLVAAASLALNLTLYHHDAERIPDEPAIELSVALAEAISRESKSPEALQGLLLALGWLVYEAPLDSEVVQTCQVLEAGKTVLEKKREFPKEALVAEIGEELLGKGLRRP